MGTATGEPFSVAALHRNGRRVRAQPFRRVNGRRMNEVVSNGSGRASPRNSAERHRRRRGAVRLSFRCWPVATKENAGSSSGAKHDQTDSSSLERHRLK